MRVVTTALLATAALAGVPHPAPEMPSGWAKALDPVPTDHVVELMLSLKQTNLDKVVEIVQSVSDPESKSYGKYLTSAELADMTTPTAEHQSTVESWLKEANVDFKKLSHNVIQASVKTGVAASLLNTNFHHVVNRRTGQKIVQADTYQMPENVEEAVAAVYGMHGFPLPPKAPAMGQPAKVTPAVLEKTYEVSGVKPSGSEKNRQAVAEFQGQTMKTKDLTSFFHKFVPNASSSPTVHKFVPGPGTGTAGIEASLDIEYIMSVAPGVLTEFWYWKGQDFCKDLQQWTSTILSTDDAPIVHSVSYGWQGKMTQIGCKDAQIQDIDANFAKLAAKGTTIIFASGDSGSGYSPMPDSEGRPGKGKKTLYPSWPASSPWVTAVGSTRFQGQKIGSPEMATDQFGSGGGFSPMFDAFDAQKQAIAKYLAIAPKLPPNGSFPRGGRATPDVAALGEGFQVITDGQTQSVGGTSASAPTFAGLVSLLNDARLTAGKPAMGYLNPWLYKNPGAFTDITVGTNAIDRGGEKIKYGFECTKGWDPVTGLGTPIFSKMLSAAMSNTTSTPVVVV